MTGRAISKNQPLKIHSPAAITASASPIDLPGEGYIPNVIYLGATGSPVLTTEGGDITFANLVAGIWHPMPNFTHMTDAGGATGVVVGVSP